MILRRRSCRSGRIHRSSRSSKLQDVAAPNTLIGWVGHLGQGDAGQPIRPAGGAWPGRGVVLRLAR